LAKKNGSFIDAAPPMAQGLGFKLSAQPAGSPPHQALETWGR